MKNIMFNTNQPVAKEKEAVKTAVAESPVKSTVQFTWDDKRFTIEHHRISEWTIVIGHTNDSLLPLVYEQRISTFHLSDILNKYLN